MIRYDWYKEWATGAVGFALAGWAFLEGDLNSPWGFAICLFLALVCLVVATEVSRGD